MAQSIGGGLDDALSKWLKSVETTQNLTVADKTAVNLAGAEVFQKALTDETRDKHYSSHKNEKAGHAADHITKWTGNKTSKRAADTDFSGVVTVGWDNKWHAMNMMRVNDGTRKMKGDHFITNLRANSSLRETILEAEQKKYKEIMDRKRSQGGD